MVFIEELSREPLLNITYFHDSERQHRYASKASGGSSSCCHEEVNTNKNEEQRHYPGLLALVPMVTLLYMATCDNLRSKSDVFVFSLGVLSYVIGMDLILAKTMNTVDVFVE